MPTARRSCGPASSHTSTEPAPALTGSTSWPSIATAVVSPARGRTLWGSQRVGFLTALLLPLINGALALAAGAGLGLPVGDLMLLTVLAASASYIAVPAAMRLALPEANPSTYLAMSLAITFPFNILFGIPLYYQLAGWLT